METRKNKLADHAFRVVKIIKQVPLWCYGIMAFIVMIVLSNIYNSFFICLLFLWFLWYVFIRVDEKEWRENYPELEEYWRLYPKAKTNTGTQCYYCGSKRIDSYLWKKRTGRRVHYCHQCRTDLYRTNDD